jgi:hypothetical protein
MSGAGLSLDWADDVLTIRGGRIPGGDVRVWYLEAYCRPGSTNRDWGETVIGHRTTLRERSPDGRCVKLHCGLGDGVMVEHVITAGADEVDFRLTITNPTREVSQAHWAQPCIRLEGFTGGTAETYLPKCFIFLDGKLARLPVKPWATKARYVPGQVWCPPHVDRNDVNPRPLSRLVPSQGLIGAFSRDETAVLATAWEPYQELFQGVFCCLHSDFRIGGVKPGETKTARGRIYIVDADVDRLAERYEGDFPEHTL